CQPPRPANQKTETVTAHDTVADIEPHESEQLAGGCVEFAGRARVTGPVESQVGRKNAPARDGRDVGDVRQNPRVIQKPHEAQVVQRRAKAASGKCETYLHGSVCAAGRSDSQPSLDYDLLLISLAYAEASPGILITASCVRTFGRT